MTALRALGIAVALCGAAISTSAWAGDIALQVEGGPAATEIQQEIEGWAPGSVAFVGFGMGEIGARINKPRGRGNLVEQAAEDGRTNGAAVVLLIRMVNPKTAYVLAIDTANVSTILDQQIPMGKKGKRKKRKKRGGPGRDLSALKRALKPVFDHAANASPGGGDGGESGGGGGEDTASGGDGGGGGSGSDSGGGSGSGTDWGAPAWAGSGGGSSGTKQTPVDSGGDSGGGDAADDDDDADDDSDDSGSSVRRTRRHRRGASGVTTAGILIETGFDPTGRKMEYSKRETRNLRPYDAMGIKVLPVKFEIYPGAFFTDGIAANIGIGAEYNMAVGLSSSPKEDEGTSVGTTYGKVNLDLRVRVPLDKIVLTPFVGYGSQSMLFDVPATETDLVGTVPEVAYTYVRPGVNLRFDIDPVAVLFEVAYRHNLSTGTVGESYFPSSSTIAFDVKAGLAYQLTSFLEARLHADVAYVGYTMNAKSDAQYVAESAYDLIYSMGRLTLVAFF